MDRPRRTPKPRLPYSPLDAGATEVDGGAGRRRSRRSCDGCGVPLAARLGGRPTRTVNRSDRSVRYSCANCSLKQKLDRFSRRGQGTRPAPSAEERCQLEAEFGQFADLMRQHLDDPVAAQLFCPVIRKKPCACIQKYILGSDRDSDGLADCLQRGKLLLDLRKKAEQLRKLKFLDKVDEVSGTVQSEPAASRRPGLGGGHRKNPAYESLVLQQRLRLKEDLSLCETASQRVLLYSNCFLHRRLRTDPLRQNRVQKTNEKRHKVLLKPISEISTITCCPQNCTKMADTYSALVAGWRRASSEGQRAARAVLAEMLTPCASGTRNCLTFVHLVTGCSDRTMKSVLVQLETSHGDRTPPVHGLKSYWARRKAQKGPAPDSTPDVVDPDNPADRQREARAGSTATPFSVFSNSAAYTTSKRTSEPTAVQNTNSTANPTSNSASNPVPYSSNATVNATSSQNVSPAAVLASHRTCSRADGAGSTVIRAVPAGRPDDPQTLMQHQSATIEKLKRQLAEQQQIIDQQRRHIDSLTRRPL